MIDFITLTRDPNRTQALRQSIEACLGGWGQEWGLQEVDGQRYDLFAGYNWGANQTHGDILAFVHDDVQLLANRLAMQKPLELLEDAATGFIGIAGNRTLLADGGPWWREETLRDARGMAGHPSDNELGLHWNVWPDVRAALFGRVAVLDGVLLICRRDTFERLGGFADKCYEGFHFYDIDITFRATLAQLANYAAPIPLFHGSVGFLTQEWETNRQIFLSRFGSFLPLSV
jgi:hypothetical protein